jgi:hypothetical protein
MYGLIKTFWDYFLIYKLSNLAPTKTTKVNRLRVWEQTAAVCTALVYKPRFLLCVEAVERNKTTEVDKNKIRGIRIRKNKIKEIK